MTCGNLRWKGYRPGMPVEEALEAFFVNRVQYQCLRTCLPWGVDDNPAAPELCRAGRACFAPAADGGAERG